MVIPTRFETVSEQNDAYAQERSHSIDAESFSRAAKSNKRKKDSASRVTDIKQTVVI